MDIRQKLKDSKYFLYHVLHTGLWGLIVPILSALHAWVSEKLNNWENWRTETEHQKYYTAKVCTLRLLNQFIAMYYIAIFQKSLSGVGFQVACFMFSGILGDLIGHFIVQFRFNSFSFLLKLNAILNKKQNLGGFIGT